MSDQKGKQLLHAVREAVLKPGFRAPYFILGVSGGPDSMALMYLLHQAEFPALIVHINYGKRGKDSDLDQELVEGMAFEWGFECITVKAELEHEGNFQNSARDFRYRIFRNLKEEYNADAIITAHHKDDQVETILQKVLRGSSISAWKGMSVFDGEILRPLLSFTKDEIVQYCEDNAVPYRIDASNHQSSFARNFLRKDFKEEMDQWFPGWEENILRLADRAEEWEKAMALPAENVMDGIRIHIEKLQLLDESLHIPLIKVFLEHHNIVNVTAGELEEINRLLDAQPGKKVSLSDSTDIVRDRDFLSLKTDKNNTLQELVILNKEEVVDDGYTYSGFVFAIKKKKIDIVLDRSDLLMLDSSQLKWPLTIARWESGDKIQPLGMAGHKKVSDLLTDRKIAPSQKEKILVLKDRDATIQAILYPPADIQSGQNRGTISESAKITDETKEILTIKTAYL